MQKHILILIILIIPFLVFLPQGSSGNQILAVQESHSYNFTALPYGTYPSNASWIGFSSSKTNSYSSFAVEPSTPAPGMNVSVETVTPQSPEYFNMTINATSNSSIKLTFSWNDNFNTVSTEDNFIIWQQGIELMHYSIGPHGGGDQYLQGKDSTKIGSDPLQSSYYTAEFSWNQQNPGKGFFSIENGYNASGSFPYVVQLNDSFTAGPLTLSVGGYEANVTLYSISFSSSNSGFTSANMSSLSYFTIDSGDLTGNAGIITNPFLSIADNDVFFLGSGQNSSIGYWNYENSTVSMYPAMPVMENARFVAFYNSTSYGIIEHNQSSSFIEVVNLTTLSLEKINVGTLPYDIVSAYSIGGQLAVVSGPDLLSVNLTSGAVEKIYYGGSYVSIVEARLNVSSLTGTIMNSSSGRFYYFSYSAVHGFSLSDTGINPTAGLSVESNITGDESMQSVISMSSSPEASFFINYNGRVMVTDPQNWNGSGIVSYAVSGSGLIYLMGNRTVQTDISVSNVTGIWMGQNFSNMALAANGTIYILYTKNVPLSPYGISVSLSDVHVETANFSVPYNVSTSLEYSVYAYLNGTHVLANDGNVDVNVTGLTSGTYELSLLAKNAAGYSQSASEYIEIDTLHPAVSVTPGNGSYVSTNQTFEFVISGVPAGGYTNLSAGGSWETFHADSFSFQLTGEIGIFTINLNYSDPFGILHTYRFRFDAIEGGIGTGTVSISNGTFLPSGTLRLSWPKVSNASGYVIILQTGNTSQSHITTGNSTELDAGNGNHTVTILAELLDGTNVTVAERHFTVEAYSPRLSVSLPANSYLSFYTDSPYHNLNLLATTNVSALISFSLIFDGNTIGSWHFTGIFANLDLGRSSGLFHGNGSYTLYVNATGMSGLSSSKVMEFSVNNSMPYMGFLPSGIIYLNTTLIGINAHSTANVTYSYSAAWKNGSLSGNITEVPIQLPNPDTTYSLAIRGRSIWGAVAYSNSTIYSWESRPEIAIGSAENVLVSTDTLRFSYSIIDPLNVSVSVVLSNGTSVFHSTLHESTVSVTFHSDGIYNLSLLAADWAGNQNESQISNISVEYYPEITSLKIGDSMFMGFGYLYPIDNGKYLQNMQFSWYVDGKYLAGSNVHVFLMPGFHHITLSATFQGHIYTASETIFVPGFLPELIALGTLAAVSVVYRYTFRYDEASAEGIVLSMKGSSMRSILREIRRSRIRKSAARKAIERLLSSGVLQISMDPDGNEYLMPPKMKG